MKQLLFVVLCVAAIAGAALYLNRQKPSPVSSSEPLAETLVPKPPEPEPSTAASVTHPKELPVPTATVNATPAPIVSAISNEADINNSINPTPFHKAMDILVSPQSNFQQRQAAWKQLRDAGELDQALANLKDGASNNPSSAEYSTALGEAYVYKLQTLKDFNEVAILALKADQSFNAALGVDPANWEAQFFKAASLSHWPADMNKSPEVIQQLSHLIDQQETMPSQPQFAQTYLMLGDQYKKAGQPDYAIQTWRFGLAKFPGNPALQGRMTQP